jgi:hypothetical protein
VNDPLRTATNDHYETTLNNNVMAKPTPSPTAQPPLTEATEAPTPEAASPTAEWSPPTVAIERQQHRVMLSKLPLGSALLIWTPSGRSVNGWTWCGLSGSADCLVRSPEGEIRSVRSAWVRPAPGADA